MIAGYMWATTEKEKEQCFAVRRTVFVGEQGFSPENEFDGVDATAHHLLFLDDEKPVGAARLYEEDGQWHIGRLCNLSDYRGKGIGKFLLRECISKARELDRQKQISLGAQEQARGFYEKQGFTAYGTPYLDEHCPHINMIYTGVMEEEEC